MNRFAVVGVLAFLVAAVAMPTLAQTGPNPPAATMPPAPVSPSSPLAPLNAQHTHVFRPAQRVNVQSTTVQSTTGTRVPTSTLRAVPKAAPAAPLKR